MANRGFGKSRFSQLCEENGFDFVLRINENLIIEKECQRENLKQYDGKNISFDAYIVSSSKDYHIEIQAKNGATWFLMMPLRRSNGALKYQKRFAIEKCFQDQKSSGFNIEKCKIRKYARFKRLYFSMCLAQLFTVMIGKYVTNRNHPLKKLFLQPRERFQHFQAWIQHLQTLLLQNLLNPKANSSKIHPIIQYIGGVSLHIYQ